MDELASKFFDTPETYAKAIQLLARYENVEHLNWEHVEAYLSELDSSESRLLEQAIDHRTVLRQHHRPQHQIQALEEKVDRLIKALEDPSIDRSILKTVSVSQETARTPTQTKLIQEDDLLLSEAIQRFIEFKQNSVTTGTLTSIRSKLDLFSRFYRSIKATSQGSQKSQPPRYALIETPW